MSLFSHKSAQASVQPWSQIITLAEADKGCDGLFNLYNTLGDVTLIGTSTTVDTPLTIGTVMDGPDKVVRYGALTIGDGTNMVSLTASQRCKGLTILCDSLTVKNKAVLNMTGRGARVLVNDDTFFPFDDYRIPFRISLSSSRMALAQALAVIKASGLAPWDRGTWQALVAAQYGFDLAVSLAGSVALMLATGCGIAGLGAYATGGYAFGGGGGAGSNGAPGGGGGGGCGGGGTGYAQYGCPASPYGGGSGGAAFYGGSGFLNGANYHRLPGYSGRGGGVIVTNGATTGSGAGNPAGDITLAGGTLGGDGVGGKLTIICRGVVTVLSGGKIEANGVKGGDNVCGGGSSGGGHISIISPALPSNSGTIQAAGGAQTGSGFGNGGAGGAGSVVTKTFSDMGW